MVFAIMTAKEKFVAMKILIENKKCKLHSEKIQGLQL